MRVAEERKAVQRHALDVPEGNEGEFGVKCKRKDSWPELGLFFLYKCLPTSRKLLRVNRLLSSSASSLEFPHALSIVDNFEESDYLALIHLEQFLMHRI
jgi:hypothetical protein